MSADEGPNLVEKTPSEAMSTSDEVGPRASGEMRKGERTSEDGVRSCREVGKREEVTAGFSFTRSHMNGAEAGDENPNFSVLQL